MCTPTPTRPIDLLQVELRCFIVLAIFWDGLLESISDPHLHRFFNFLAFFCTRPNFRNASMRSRPNFRMHALVNIFYVAEQSPNSRPNTVFARAVC